jgi:hypothetical protein
VRPGPLDTDCHEWVGANDGSRARYGRLSDGHGKLLYVHRVAWAVVNGPILDGLQVLHKCDNPPCINVEHLFLGTNADNVRDKVSKGRQFPSEVRTHCYSGHEYTVANTYIRPDGKGRDCNACKLDALHRFYARKRALLSASNESYKGI